MSSEAADTARVPGAHRVYGSTEKLLTDSSETSEVLSDSLPLIQQATNPPHHYVATSVSSSLIPSSESSDRGRVKSRGKPSSKSAQRVQQFPALACEADNIDGRTVLEQVQLLHARGECAPCSFFMKKAGCANGDLCRHCHVCKKKAKPRLGKNQRLRYMRMADGIVEGMKQSKEPTTVMEQLHPFLTSLLRKRGVPVGGGATAAEAEQEEEEEDFQDVMQSSSKLSL